MECCLQGHNSCAHIYTLILFSSLNNDEISVPFRLVFNQVAHFIDTLLGIHCMNCIDVVTVLLSLTLYGKTFKGENFCIWIGKPLFSQHSHNSWEKIHN